MTAAQNILFQINSSNYTNGIATIYNPTSGHSGFVTTLRITINLNSIAETTFPHIPDDTPPAVLEQILDEVAVNTEFKEITLFFKKGDGSWLERCPMKIFNKEPFYDVNLMRLFSDANTIDVAEDFSLGIQIKAGNTLTEEDKILVWGSVVEEKKNNGNEELAARIEALELALAGRLTEVPANTLLGRNSSTGIVEAIPQSTFAKPSDINIAISNLVGGAPGALNTLDELAAALGDDANFASSVINQLAGKAPLLNAVFSGFTTLGGNIAIKQVEITGTTGSAAADVAIAHGITGTIRAVTCIVVDSFNRLMAPGMTLQGANNEYYVYTTLSHFVVYTAGSNSSHVVNRPFKALITYSP